MGTGADPGTLCTSSPCARRGCQAGSALGFRRLSLIQSTKVLMVLSTCLMPPLMLNCPLGCQQQPLATGDWSGLLRGALGMDLTAAFGSQEEDECCCLMGCFLTCYLFQKLFFRCSVLNEACWRWAAEPDPLLSADSAAQLQSVLGEAVAVTKPHHCQRRCGDTGGREPEDTAGGPGPARDVPELRL